MIGFDDDFDGAMEALAGAVDRVAALACLAGGGADAAEAVKDLREARAGLVKQAHALTEWAACAHEHHDTPLGHAEALADHLRHEAPDTAARVCEALQGGHVRDLRLIMGG